MLFHQLGLYRVFCRLLKKKKKKKNEANLVKTDDGRSRKGLDILIPIALLRMYSSRKKSSERASPAFPASVTARRKNTTTTKEDGVTDFIENVEQLFSMCACGAIVAAWLRCISESSASTGGSRQDRSYTAERVEVAHL